MRFYMYFHESKSWPSTFSGGPFWGLYPRQKPRQKTCNVVDLGILPPAEPPNQPYLGLLPGAEAPNMIASQGGLIRVRGFCPRQNSQINDIWGFCRGFCPRQDPGNRDRDFCRGSCPRLGLLAGMWPEPGLLPGVLPPAGSRKKTGIRAPG